MNTIVCMRLPRYMHRYKPCCFLLCFFICTSWTVNIQASIHFISSKTFLFLKSFMISPLIILQILKSRCQCWSNGQWQRGFAVLKSNPRKFVTYS